MARRFGHYLSVLLIAWLVILFRDGQAHSSPFLSGGTHKVLLLTAHPDDECMFFAPTIVSLIQNSVAVYSLCLSVGDAEGLGNTREKELRNSLRVLGIPPERSQIIDHPLLQDTFTQEWNSEVIADVVGPYILENNITAVLTFDDHGVSQHPNHISLPNGVSRLLSMPSAPSTQLFTLRTVPLIHKYIGPMSNPLTRLSLWLPWTSTDHQTYVADYNDYGTAVRAMYQHQSQFVWFRWLYVLFSRYMWINEWVEIQLPETR